PAKRQIPRCYFPVTDGTITVTLPSGQTTSLTRYQSIDNKSGQAQDD
ncbi:hypothetical protein ACAG08_26455, partial [Escherichia coli]